MRDWECHISLLKSAINTLVQNLRLDLLEVESHPSCQRLAAFTALGVSPLLAVSLAIFILAWFLAYDCFGRQVWYDVVPHALISLVLFGNAGTLAAPDPAGVVLPRPLFGRNKRQKRTSVGDFGFETCGGDGMSEGNLRLNLNIVLGLLFGGKDRYNDRFC